MSRTSGGGWFTSNRSRAGFTGGARPPTGQVQRRPPPPAAHNARDGYAYGVHIVKHGNGIMGLQLDGNLFIRQVNDGLVKDWNMANKNAEVLVGDQIVLVNGIRGDVDAMFAAIKTHRELNLTLHRYSAQYSSQAPQQLTEEEQLQWAIRRSMDDATAASSAAAAGEAQPPQSTGQSSTAKEGQELGIAVPKDGFMDAAEVQKLLEAAEAQKAQVAAERSELRQQVTENESIIKGLTDQLDAVNRQLREKTAKCEALEAALTKSQRAGATLSGVPNLQEVAGEEEQQGVVSQLLVRIQELEATLQQATHFAPVEKTEEEEVAEATAVATPTDVVEEAAGHSQLSMAEVETAPPAELAAAAAADEQPESDVIGGAEATSAEPAEKVEEAIGAEALAETEVEVCADEAPQVLDLTGDVEAAASAEVTATEVAA